MPKKEKSNKPISKEELTNKAVKVGLNALISSDPNLRNYAVLISNGLDNKKISQFVYGVEKKIKEENIPYEQHNETLYKSLANYVSSGNALKDTVRQTILEKGHDGKLHPSILEKIVEIFKPNKFEAQKYFEKSKNLYGEMYDILSQDEVAQNEIPELTKAAKAMKMYGFLDVALKSFKAHGMMDDKLYKSLSKTLYETTAVKAAEGKKGLENYIISGKEEGKQTAQKVAASIIGFLGIMIMIFNVNITGAAIGESSKATISSIGAFMIFFALLLFFRPLKKALKTKRQL